MCGERLRCGIVKGRCAGSDGGELSENEIVEGAVDGEARLVDGEILPGERYLRLGNRDGREVARRGHVFRLQALNPLGQHCHTAVVHDISRQRWHLFRTDGIDPPVEDRI